MPRLLLISLAIALAAVPAEAQDRIRYGESAMAARQLSVPELSVPDAGMGLWTQVTVSPTGEVIDAVPDPLNPPRDKVDPKPALAAARTVRFRPFLFKGRPVTAVGAIWVSYGAKTQTPRRENPRADFPPVDYGALSIELVRGDGCDGYRMTIDGAGNAMFAMQGNLANARPLYSAYISGWRVAGGVHRGTIDRARLDLLLERLRAVRFFGLRETYVLAADSCPSVLHVRIGEAERTVRWDILGEIPGQLHGIAEAIEAALDSGRWIKGNDRTTASLVSEGVDLHGEDGAYLAAAAVRVGNEQVALEAIAAGAPLALPFPAGIAEAPLLGIWLVREAARRGATRVIAFLAERGWLARMSRAALSELLASTAGGCEPSIIRALASAGADVNYRLYPASAANSGIPSGASALTRLLVPNLDCGERDREPALEALIALGVDVNTRDASGTPAILLWPDDALALHLLEAGAKPAGTDSQGRTLRQIATERRMSGTLAWLDAHQMH